MIEHIKNIGQYVKNTDTNNSVLKGMVNSIASKELSTILLINVQQDKIQYDTRDFEKEIVYDALYWQSGRGAEGGGIRLDYYEQQNPKKEFKGRDKLKKACEFCEVGSRFEEIRDYIEQYLKEKDKKTFAVIQVDGKMPRELFEDKFIKKMYAMVYKGIEGEHTCHLCGQIGKGYNTTTYKFYTNDKAIYHNINDKVKSGVTICEQCLKDILLGKQHVEQYLTTYWKIIGKKVMFLPHTYDKEVDSIYKSTSIRKINGTSSLITTIRLNEEDLIDEIGKTNTTTDIIFYEDDSKYFYINYQIQSVLPSRFSYISDQLKNYELRLFSILQYVGAVKVSLDNVDTTQKEKIRILDCVFSAKQLNRALFFKRVMTVYKHHYLNGHHRKYACIKNINKIYNFLCDCQCLEKGWKVLQNYKSYNELFEVNPVYFNSNEKKAWFLLGMAYNKMIYFIQSKDNAKDNVEDEQKDNDRTSLEKTFFFARKFDFNDFIYFSNLLKDKQFKYKIEGKKKTYFSNLLNEAKDYISKKENQLSYDEAKYLFFWGMDAYFKAEKKTDTKDIKETETKESEGN